MFFLQHQSTEYDFFFFQFPGKNYTTNLTRFSTNEMKDCFVVDSFTVFLFLKGINSHFTW